MSKAVLATRGYAFVEGRQVHYRLWGSGPLIVALHGSPQSSRAIEPFAQRLTAEGFSVLAPDTPGNGCSEPLSTSSTILDFAKALDKLLVSLGIKRCALYGFHTGAAIASTYAALHKEKVSCIFFDGLPAWDDEERAELVEYLPHFVPRWDGSHMTWLWARLEEQQIYFPWQLTLPSKRMKYSVSPAERIHLNALDFLEAGDDYRASYRAAFRFRVSDWLGQVRCPMIIGALAADPLAQHLGRAAFNGFERQSFESIPQLWESAVAFFADHADASSNQLTKAAAGQAGFESGFSGQAGEQIFWTWYRSENRTKPPLLLLHAAGRSSRQFGDLPEALASHRDVVVVDLPGHGRSDASGDFDAVEMFADAIGRACADLGLEKPVAAGIHLGGQIATALVVRGAASAAATFGVSDWSKSEAELVLAHTPSLIPEWDGSHLLRAFRIARYKRLFHPWFMRNAQNMLGRPGDLDPTSIHDETVDLVRAGPAWRKALQAEMNFDWEAMRDHASKITVFAIDNDPLSQPDKTAVMPNRTVAVSANPGGWLKQLSQWQVE